MSRNSDLERLFSEAEDCGKRYDWLKEAGLYRKAIDLAEKGNPSIFEELYEKLGYSLYRASFQEETLDAFRTRGSEALESYQKARDLCVDSNHASIARRQRSEAMISLISYWLASDVSEKKKNIDECWNHAEKSLEAFEQGREPLQYGKTFNQLSISVGFAFLLASAYENRERLLTDAVKFGECAIKNLSGQNDEFELAKAYARASTYQISLATVFPKANDQVDHASKAKEYTSSAEALSPEARLMESVSVLERIGLDAAEGTDKALELFEKALDLGRKMRDHFAIGSALDRLAYHTAWRASLTEDPEEPAKCLQKAFELSKEAKEQFSKLSFVSPGYGFFWSESPEAEYLWLLAVYEIDPDKKRKMLEKAVSLVPELLNAARLSGYPNIVDYAHHTVSKIFVTAAQVESAVEKKRALLEKALEHRRKTVETSGDLMPRTCWDTGIMLARLGDLKQDLSDLAETVEAKKKLLLETISDRKRGMELLVRALSIFKSETGPSSLLVDFIGIQHQNAYALVNLYQLTKEKELLTEAASEFAKIISSLRVLENNSWLAMVYWQFAQVWDDMGEYMKSADAFNDAHKNFEAAAAKIPQLKERYHELAMYMQSWSEIERARYYHAKQEHRLAMEHFEKAAGIQKGLKNWSYMSSNYSAWVKVENGENLSRNEQSEEAIQAFTQAGELFVQSEESLRDQLEKIEDLERQVVLDVLKATDLMQEYCKARIAIEEAKIFDKKGDHSLSSEKYGHAAKLFEKIIPLSVSEQQERELKYVHLLAQAWQKMTQAEAEVSPELYVAASKLFEEAKDLTTNEKTKMLILAHSRFSKALEAGTVFSDTRDMETYRRAVVSLETAGNYYIKAGFPKASEYAKATRLLFDAYVHIDNAKKESDPEKRAKLCVMAEKVLQTAAGSFLKAEHPEKREQVLALLETVKEERDLAQSLVEVLHAPSIMSATTSFNAPACECEEPVGSETFQKADVQANVILSRKELKVGENLEVEIELVNAGRSPAVLVKINDGVPEGFDLTRKPDLYSVEDRHFSLKGKRLEPLRAEEIKYCLKPRTHGEFELRPKVLYLSEDGRYKSRDVEPTSITVTELGIKGWLKGER